MARYRRPSRTIRTYVVCDSCATAIVNNDTTGISDPETLEAIEAFVSRIGNVAHTGPTTTDLYDGYFDCPACEGTVVGPGQILETV